MDGTGYAVIWLKELRSREKWMRGEHNIRLKHCIPDLRTASDRAVGVVPRYRNREVLRPSPSFRGQTVHTKEKSSCVPNDSSLMRL